MSERIAPHLFWIVVCIPAFLFGQSPSQTSLPGSWIADSYIESLTVGDGKAFVTGSFSWVGPYSGGGVLFDQSTFAKDNSFPQINGSVLCVISDGSGGWFVGGEFLRAGNVAVKNFVHILSDKTIDPLWKPQFNQSVTALLISGGRLYAGGDFTSVGTTVRNRLASFNISDATLTSWDPDVNGYTDALVANGTDIIFGGQFSTVGGQTRSNIAAVSATTGILASWNPGISGINAQVHALKIAGGLVYVAGAFSTAGGSPRRSLASIDLSTGLAGVWNPNADPAAIFPPLVESLIIDGSTVYAGGGFNTIGGQVRPSIAALDISTGAVITTFNANVSSGLMWDIALSGSDLYLGGSFSTIAGQPQPGFAIVDKTTGALKGGDIDQTGTVLAINTSNNVFVGGTFNALKGLNGVDRDGAAAIDLTTGEATAWNPNFESSGSGVALEYHNNELYYWDGGDGAIGKLNTSDGNIIPGWTASSDGYVGRWTFTSDKVYANGSFLTVNTQSRNGFAAINLSDGSLDPWQASVQDGDDFNIEAMANHGGRIFLGGRINVFDAQPRDNLIALDATTGNVINWNPVFNNAVYALAVYPPYLYVGGEFTMVNGLPLQNLVRFDLTTLELDTSWNPNIEFGLYGVTSILKINSSLFITGSFGSVGGQARSSIAELDEATGTPTAWNPDMAVNVEGGRNLLGNSTNHLVVAGDLEGIDNDEKRYLAIFSLTPTTPNSPPTISSTSVNIAVGQLATIDLLPLLSDLDDNLDLTTLRVVNGETERGAPASINSNYVLEINYSGSSIVGLDHVTIEVCDDQGLCVQQTLSIELIADIEIYTGVSPNGDGLNDFWLIQYIDSIEETRTNKVSIFNRWGDEVFSTENYNNDDRVFKGINNNGNALPSGVYFYRIEFSEGRPTQTGYLNLKR
ncbi:MAG: gliding motility-associated C-terminal domain-containing protein [Cyclobacteriaceae bacterium]|nr:gliding motility-associated C-terminal domain-containing protein [Cyclobacteriaceae bacterium]